MTEMDTRKRGPDGILLEPKEKRARIGTDSRNKSNIMNKSNTHRRNQFLMCHLQMLRSLYENGDHGLDHPETTWKQIEEFIKSRPSLQEKNTTVNTLEESLEESKKIAQEPELSTPLLKRYNTSLKTESRMFISFLTQQQHGQIHSLSLNSPNASHINMQQQKLALSPFHRQPGNTKQYLTPVNGCGHNRHQSASSQLKSMNLVTSIIQKRFHTAVQIANKEKEVFLPLLEVTENHIVDLEKKLKHIDEQKRHEVNIENMSEEEILAAAYTLEGCNTDVNNCNQGETKYQVDEHDRTVYQSRLALWHTLLISLDSILNN